MNYIIEKILENNNGLILQGEDHYSFLVNNTKILKKSIGSSSDSIINHPNFENNFSLNYLIDELIKDGKNEQAENLIQNNDSKISVDAFNKLTISAITSKNYDIKFVKKLLGNDKVEKSYFEVSLMVHCVAESKLDVIKEFAKTPYFNLLGRHNHHIIDAINGNKTEIVKTMMEYNNHKFKDNSNKLFRYALKNGTIDTIKEIINDKNINLKKYKLQDFVLFDLKENYNKETIDYLFNHKKFVKIFDTKNIEGRFSEEDSKIFKHSKNKLKKKIGVVQ